ASCGAFCLRTSLFGFTIGTIGVWGLVDMMWRLLWKYVHLLVLLLVISFGLISSYLFSQAAFVEWVQLGEPPADSPDLVGIWFFEPFIASAVVQDADGNLYRGSSALCDAESSCWVSVAASAFQGDLMMADTNFDGDCAADTSYSLMKSLLSPTEVCLEYDDVQVGTHFIRTAKAAIDVDGQIWLWQFIPGSGALLIIVRSVVAGFLLALAVWLVRSLMKQ
ncbi:MAG: hypothetical protein KDE28_22575, partial [Anaerolineales bacterium]|nr:hypothetical protein [Anaerolineales bacterium]